MAEIVNKEGIPRHIGIVMDGNGRWAKERGLPRIMGHHAGVRTVEEIGLAARDLGVSHLSLYAFSTENWKRPKGEVMGLMGLFRYYVRGKISAMNRDNMRMRFAGRLVDLPEDVQAILHEAEEQTGNNTGMDLIFCINYGGRQEILDGINRALASGKTEFTNEDDFHSYLYLPDVPDPDLLIRTGGELRMSNFWLWSGAYSEYYFSDKYWPDFDAQELEKAIESYARRERRYGTA